MKQKIYKLNRGKDAWGHIDFMQHQEGAICIPTNNDFMFHIHMLGIKPEELPETIFFASDFNIISEIDFPHNDLGLDIVSNRMLSVITDVNDFNYRKVEVTMFDHKEMEAYHIEDGELLEDLKKRNEDYIAIQLMEYTDAFDYDNSEYRMQRSFPDKVGSIRKLVLKEPEDNYPPIFKIKEKKSQLFITEQAKIALEAVNIKGCVFEEVLVSV